jgi:hypothetical protein
MKKFIFLALLYTALGCDNEPAEIKKPTTSALSEKPNPTESLIPKDEPSVKNSLCKTARLGLNKHGGLILFENLGVKCFMVSVLQILLHNGPLFDALCELDESKLKKDSATFMLHKLFKITYDPDRDPQKPYNAQWFANSMTEDFLGQDFTSGFQSPDLFIGKFLEKFFHENLGTPLTKAFALKYANEPNYDVLPLVYAWGGNSLAEAFTKYFTKMPFSPPLPDLIIADIGQDEIPTAKLKEIINIPGAGDYKIIGVSIHAGYHYWVVMKDLEKNSWKRINSLPPKAEPISFQDVIKEIGSHYVQVIALQRADYKMRH